MRTKIMYFSGVAAILLVAAGFLIVRAADSKDANVVQDLPAITVYKSPTCGCCAKWVDHLEENGFEVESIDTPDVNVTKVQYGVPGELSSCHTAIVDGYVVEGHVPADVIKKMLADKPEIVGIAVPGMPMGSPGMEGSRVDHYDVIAFQEDGARSVFASR